MEELVAAVTYSKDGYKKPKNRKYFDGSLKINQNTRTCQLFSEDGKYISSGKLPEDIQPGVTNEEFELEKHLLVLIDSISSTSQNNAPHKENSISASLPRPSLSKIKRIPRPAPPQSSFSQTTAPLPFQPSNSQNTAGLTASSFRPTPSVNAPRERSTAEILSLLHMTPSLPPASLSSSIQNTTRLPTPINNNTNNNNNQPHQFQRPVIPDNNSIINNNRNPTTTRLTTINTTTTTTNTMYNTTTTIDNNNASTRDQQQRSWQQHTAHSMHSMHRNTIQSPPLPLPQPNTPGTIYFPTEKESTTPQRHITIPTSFTSIEHYQKQWDASLSEEIVLKICETSKDFYKTINSGNVQNILGRVVNGSGAGAALESTMRRAKVDYYGACELFIWKNYPGSNKNKNNNHNNKQKRKRKQHAKSSRNRKNTHHHSDDDDDDDDDTYDHNDNNDDDDDEVFKPENIYLILRSGRAKSAEYHKGDVWIISNDPLFRSGFDPGQIGDKTRAPWTAVVKSVWHGPNQDGKFEVEFLSSRPPSLVRSQQVYAIKSHEASMELSLIDVLRSDALQRLPIVKSLLSSSSTVMVNNNSNTNDNTNTTCITTNDNSTMDNTNDELDNNTNDDDTITFNSPMDLCNHIITSFHLNPEQAAVLTHTATWTQHNNTNKTNNNPPTSTTTTTTTSTPASPVCLVHGPFGSGKSSLLVALLHFFLSIRKYFPNSPLGASRILVTAHTNVAVDRVLLGLLQSGVKDFLRVGALRRIDKRLLSQSLHASESKAHASATAELKEMLREAAGNPFEEAVLRAELAAAERGSDRHKKKLLKTSPVVGVTCCSSMLSVLNDSQFDIVILDESSQMIEPLSLAPMLRAKCKYLVAAGDPLQLPPVIAHPSTVVVAGNTNRNNNKGGNNSNTTTNTTNTTATTNNNGLIRPLFVRLAALGNQPYLLRRQYRCHPDISAVPNTFFYGGRLIDGCTATDRPSLLPGTPAVMFIDVRGQEERSGRSIHNMQEAHAVIRVLERLIVQHGVFPGRCGVICLYRAQVDVVRRLLQQQPWLAVAQQQQCDAMVKVTVVDDDGSGGSGDDEDEDDDFARCEDRMINSKHDGSFDVQIATVDSFQGAEKDVIILTTAATRSSQFASDECRLNVALTRAKHNLIVVGCAPVLQQGSPAFGALIKMAKSKPLGYFANGNLNL